MHHSAGMGKGQSVTCADKRSQQRSKLLGGGRTARVPLNGIAESFAAHTAHNQERNLAIGAVAKAIDRDDVRVLELSGDLSFLEEQLPVPCAGGDSPVQLLDG